MTKSKISYVKWLLLLAPAIFLWPRIESKNDDFEMEFQIGTERPPRSYFHVYVALYAGQHIIILFLHALTFITIFLFTCCCEFWDDDVPEDHNFDKELWSNSFIEYELGQLHNFEYHPRGNQELQFNRTLRFVQRQATIRR